MSVKEIKVGITEEERQSMGTVRVAYNPFDRQTINAVRVDQKDLHLKIAFFVQRAERKVAFGDGLNHEVFERAIKQDLVDISNLELGQLTVDDQSEKIKDLSLFKSKLRDDGLVRKKIILLFSLINPDILCPTGVGVWCEGQNYLYSAQLRKVTRRRVWN